VNRKSIWAVAVGVVFIVVVTTAVDVVLHVAGVYPPWDQPIGNRLYEMSTPRV
jgi:hypothetical protein